MSHRRSIGLPALSALVWSILSAVLLTTPAYAQFRPPAKSVAENSCLNCHEDLYFLHDTGKWFCLRESTMTCTDCHGGNPSANTKELAHAGRAAHPVLNEDVSKCQECHLEKCDERVDIFDRSAGIHTVLVAAPYAPVITTERTDAPAVESRKGSSAWFDTMEFLPIVLVAGAGWIVYILFRRHIVEKSENL